MKRNADWKNNSTLFAADIKKSPGSAPLNFRHGNDILVTRALPEKDTALKRRVIDTALIYINKAIAIYPEYGDAYSQRGLAYFRSGRTGEAASDYYKSIYYRTATWQVFNNLGVIYGQRNMFDSAIYFFNRAISRDATQATPQKNLGNALELKQDYAGAIRSYLQALSLNENKDVKLQKEIYSNLANCYRRTGDTTKANYYQNLSR